MRQSADRLETYLYAVSDGNEQTGAEMILAALNRKGMEGVKKSLELQLEKSIDREIVDNMSAFLKHHSTKGRRPKVAQNAVEAVQVAATFGAASETVKTLSKRLDVRSTSIQSYAIQGKDMISKGTAFVPSQVKQRSDCYRVSALKAARSFCH